MKKNIFRTNLIIGLVILFVGASVLPNISADINKSNSENLTVAELSGGGSAPSGKSDVVWDNGMDYTGLGAAQYDSGGFDAYLADDFILEEDTEVTDVHWVGGYWNDDYATGNFDWSILFYSDRGDGMAPGDVYAGPFVYPQDDCSPVLLENTTSSIYYEFSVYLDEPIVFIASEKYWISIWGIGATMPQSGWGLHDDQHLLNWGVFKSEYFGFLDWTPTFDVFGYSADLCFQLTSGEPAFPDLDCDGVLNWEDIEPSSTVTGSFTVENIGEAGSMLNWEIESYPDWGNWSFSDESGTGLTPEDGAITITVEVVAPEEGDELTGEVKIVNSDDPDDFCVIDATMTDAVSQHSLMYLFFERLVQRFPAFGRILAALF